MSSDRTPPYYGPFFLLEANGSLATEIAKDVTEFSFTDDEKKGAVLTLVISNRDMKYTDDPRFSDGASYAVRWGYVNKLSELRRAVFVKARPTFSTSHPTLEIIAYDVRVEMNRGSKAKNWGAVASSDVARSIAKRYGYKTEIENSGDARSESRIQPATVTDIQYLYKLADQLNWDCYVEKDTLHFHPKKLGEAPEHTFTYFYGDRTILSFSPEVKMDKPSGIKTTATNPKTGASEDKSGKSGDKPQGYYSIDTERAQGTYLPVGKAPGSNGLGYTTPESNANVAKKHADAKKSKIDSSAVKATVELIGTPSLRARTNIKLLGIGKQYSGVWRITSVTHKISPSGNVFVCSCKLSRNALNKGKTKTTNPNDKDAGKGSGAGNSVTIDTENGRVRR